MEIDSGSEWQMLWSFEFDISLIKRQTKTKFMQNQRSLVIIIIIFFFLVSQSARNERQKLL